MFNMYQDLIFTTFTTNPQQQRNLIKIMARIKIKADMPSDTYIGSCYGFQENSPLKILDAIHIIDFTNH